MGASRIICHWSEGNVFLVGKLPGTDDAIASKQGFVYLDRLHALFLISRSGEKDPSP